MRIAQFLPTALFSGITTGIATTATAQIVFPETPAEPLAKVPHVASNVIETISNAVQGDNHAQEILLKDYLANSLLILAVLVISYMVASAIGRSVGNFVSKRVDVTLGRFLSKAIRNLTMIVVLMVVMQSNGINVAGLAAVLAAVGFAIGLALQGTLSNFAAGIMLLIFRPFKIEDYIVVAGTQGKVEEIDLFTTRLNTPDNRHLIVPNSEIFGNKLENYSRNPIRRVEVNVGTAYAADLKITRTALERAVASVSDGSSERPPVVYLQELGASSVQWQLRVWAHPKNYWAVREELTAAAKNSLDQAGVQIPFPQMDVHVIGKLMAKAA